MASGKGIAQVTVILCHGAFDLLHAGHLAHLRAAKQFGDFLVVSVSTDEVVRKRKPGRPIQPIGERVSHLRALGFVDQVWVCTSEDAADAITLFCPSWFVKGNDYSSSSLSAGERLACERVGAKLAFTQTEKQSTTAVIERCKAA